MDLGAYMQIPIFDSILKDEGIEIPRLRGCRSMLEEETIDRDRIQEIIRELEIQTAREAVQSDIPFQLNAHWWSYSYRTDRLVHKYLQHNANGNPIAIRWDRIHGKHRKNLKYLIKNVVKHCKANFAMFNKYVGREDILYIHAKIGSYSWTSELLDEVRRQPWFVDAIDDAFDRAYCDIYIKIPGLADKVKNLWPAEEDDAEPSDSK